MSLQLRYLICASNLKGAVRLDDRRMTSRDDFHGCQSFICQNKAEWDLLGQRVVCKEGKRLWMQVELWDGESGRREKLTGAEPLTVAEERGAPSTVVDGGLPEAEADKSVRAPVGAESAGSNQFQTGEGSQSGVGEQLAEEPEPTLSTAGEAALDGQAETVTDDGASPEETPAPVVDPGEDERTGSDTDKSGPAADEAAVPKPEKAVAKPKKGKKS